MLCDLLFLWTRAGVLRVPGLPSRLAAEVLCV